MVNFRKPLLLDAPFEKWEWDDVPKYRREQVRNWIFEKGFLEWDKMSNLPKALKSDLAEKVDLLPMEPLKVQGSTDTTQKILWKLRDNQFIESVLIRATEGTKGVRASRLTLCVSTQVGCALGCKFCASGLDGLKRNLLLVKLLDRFLARNEAGRRIDNLVFMGMGEPLANLPALLPALDTILSLRDWELERHITLSTSGLVPKILELANYPAQIRLAISYMGRR